MSQVIYAKYSNQRAKRFRIRTDIIRVDGKKIIRKSGQSQEALEHVKSMAVSCQQLEKDFAGQPVAINPCRLEGQEAYFPFEEGYGFETMLDTLLESEQYEELNRKLDAYFAILNDGKGLEEYRCTDQFAEVFGELNCEEVLQCRRITDIDMVFANVICRDGIYHIIDYEWTYDFPIPVNFVIYRCLRYYILSNTKRHKLLLDQYLRRYGISEEQECTYAAMEEHFQQYITKDFEPMREIVQQITPGRRTIGELMDVYESRRMQLQIFRDYGQGFTEAQADFYEYRMEDGTITVTILLEPEVCGVRIDPLDDCCLFYVEQLDIAGSPVRYKTNCRKLGKNLYYSETLDPQIVVLQSGEGHRELTLTLQVERAGVLMRKSLAKRSIL